jgi:hypothetical protein
MSSDEHNIIEALDRNRFNELLTKSILAANLWLAINLASQRNDRADVRAKAALLSELTKSAIAVVNTLGKEDVSNG